MKTLSDFQAARRALNDALEAVRLEIDEWLLCFSRAEVSFDDVASLDCLHRARRNLSAQLRKLEDDCVLTLVEQARSKRGFLSIKEAA